MLQRDSICCLFATLSLLAASPASAGSPDKNAANDAPANADKSAVPRLAGDWWRIAAPPAAEHLPDLHKPGLEAVDFTIFQAADKTWQLISCVRGTTHPGGGRLLYRWEAKQLTDPDWQPKGVFWTADPKLGHREGTIQAPHCIRHDGKFYLFYNSGGAYCLISKDGKTFEHHKAADGQLKFFDMPRDVMVFDNRDRDGLWYAYFTDIVPGQYAERKNHTISYRTAKSLEGPWSEKKTDIGVASPTPADAYTFVFAESPFVLFRNGIYYRFEQMNVLASNNPSKWPDTILTTLTGKDPRAYLSPEIIQDGVQQYIAAYRYRPKGQGGIYLARIEWPEAR